LKIYIRNFEKEPLQQPFEGISPHSALKGAADVFQQTTLVVSILALFLSSGGKGIPHLYYSGDYIKEGVMGGACGTRVREERCMLGLDGEIRGNETTWKA